MKSTSLKKNAKKNYKAFLSKYKTHLPLLLFVAGFIFDTLTLGRVDRLYDRTVLCSHMICLSGALYFLNTANPKKIKSKLLISVYKLLPFSIQFFFGALSSAYVIYFFRSVSLSKTLSFFIILMGLLVANEFLKKRISNKYLQFGIYFFINFTFFTFMLPVFIKQMNYLIFIVSGVCSLGTTWFLLHWIYRRNPTISKEADSRKIAALIISIYLIINTFYYYKLIPPVPLALKNGVVAYGIEKEADEFLVTIDRPPFYVFWREYQEVVSKKPSENVYAFSTIFAPTALEAGIIHRWKYFDPEKESWRIVQDLPYQITGGRDDGFRGYTVKKNVWNGEWKVEVLTEDELMLGVINFTLKITNTPYRKGLRTIKY